MAINRRLWLRAALALSVGATAGLLQTDRAAAQETITWRLQTVAGAGTSEYTGLVQEFAKQVDRLTEGRLQIKVFPAGMLMSSSQVPDAVSKGALDMGQTYMVYYSGKEPALQAANEWPAMVDPLQGATWFYEAGGAEIMREIVAKHNMYFLGVSPLLGEHIWSKKPLNGIEDLKGVKLRASALAADSFAMLGASVVTLAGEEVYPALQRGIVDATEFTTLPVNYGFGFHEVTDYVIFPTYSGGVTSDWVVNMDAWNELPDDLKPLVDKALHLASDSYWKASQVEEEEVKKALQEEGTTFIEWSAEDMKTLEAARYAVMRNKYAAESEVYKKKLEHQMNFLQKLGYELPELPE